MKIAHLLESPSKLQAFISKNSHHFQQFGNIYAFIWTDQVLRSIIKAGAKTNEDLSTVTTPGEIGLGLVNATTGEICVGAIDTDYDALWAASGDVSDFFVAAGNKTLIRLPNRLQNLADLLKLAADPEQAGGVDAILDYIDEQGLEYIDVDAIKDMESGDEIREYLEDEKSKAQSHLDSVESQRLKLVKHIEHLYDSNGSDAEIDATSRKLKLLSGDSNKVVFDIEKILKQRHLFSDSDDDGDDTSTTDKDIDKWTKNFNRDFSDLDLPDARELDPN